MKTEKCELKVVSLIEQFRVALIEGVGGIVKAAEIYVRALDENPRYADVFREELSEWVPASAWAQFEAVGRKWMHPRLLMGGGGDRRKHLLIKRLPYSMQERVFKNERFSLLLEGGDTLQVSLIEATQWQADQLCNGSVIRNLGEQKAWLKDHTKAGDAVEDAPEVMPYIIRDGKVTFRKRTILDRAQVKRLLLEM